MYWVCINILSRILVDVDKIYILYLHERLAVRGGMILDRNVKNIIIRHEKATLHSTWACI